MRLSTTYKIVTGDTFDLIARKKYGSTVDASLISKANAGVSEPLTAGTSIIIPAQPYAPQNLEQNIDEISKDEAAILIDGKRFRFWDSVRITTSVDSMDTIEFTAPFDSNSKDFKETFFPFSFKQVSFKVGGETKFTGTMVDITPYVENDRKIVSVSGYSTPAVLNDCTAPASFSESKLEFNDQGLRDIANVLVAPFGLAISFDEDQGSVFERVAINPTTKILPFLVDLAQQRNLVISNTEKGELLFWKSIEGGSPVARLKQGESPVISIIPIFTPQEYYSHVTGIEPVSVGLDGSQYTVKNDRLSGIVRPLTFKVTDTENADIKQATEAKVGRMFANMLVYSVQVSTWRDPNGDLWKPNTTVTLIASDAMVYSEYEFVIRSVVFERNANATVATLNLVVIGSFSGVIPSALPWEG